jgi:carbonic anhydrase
MGVSTSTGEPLRGRRKRLTACAQVGIMPRAAHGGSDRTAKRRETAVRFAPVPREPYEGAGKTMRVLNELFEKNKQWAKNIKDSDPDFFTKLSGQQTPQYLWIGCSDSRVPATEIVDLAPGEIFVHRNIANLVIHTDLNCLSVIQYAVEVLKVKHVIVCGHYGCGGVKAAVSTQEHGLIDNWLRNIRDVYRLHRTEIDALDNEKERADRLCELNVVEQVYNLCQTTIIQKAWTSEQELTVHGWIYSIEDGILRDLNVCMSSLDEITKLHQPA